jgi:putative spermidine/putrescine transport system ATP-binding protein
MTALAPNTSTTAVTSGVSIQLTHCAKDFKGVQVLKPTHLLIERGETLVLLGPSGCGKTTTLRIIAGLETPNEGGNVFFDDECVTALPIEKRKVGMVFQSYALFPNMNVKENIEFGLKIQGFSKDHIKSRVSEMLDMMQIRMLGDRHIDTLSGGQRQRVALARAIAPRPRVLLLDEPLTALDARLRDKLRSEINALLRSLNITTIYVTHDQAEAMALGDRIAVMNKGEISQLGTPQDIYFRPANAFVADFIGTMNVINQKMFRPEDVQLVAHQNAPLQGKVVSTTFLGDHCKVDIKVNSGEKILAKTPPRQAPNVGDLVGINILSESALC